MSVDPVVFSKLAPWKICLGLAAAVLLVYSQACNFEFVNFDDDAYVYANARILQGVTVDNVYYAFTGTQGDLWHPVTTLSHLVDVELFGKWAAGHHRTSVLIHLATTIILFFALRHLTGATIESAFAAGLFALHPLRVESVAWVAERKDVLSGLFFTSLLLCYSVYVRKPTIAKYVALILVFALGLMSKPTFVTAPFVLLLLDYWPLRRDASNDKATSTMSVWWRLIIEKTPLFVGSMVVCLFTVRAQEVAIQSLRELSILDRFLNAGRSSWIYFQQFFFPTDLIAFYAYPQGDLLFWQGIAGWCSVIAISAIVVYFGRAHRFLIVGWLWSLGMLIPVLGFVQAGKQAHADRFTYLPHLGLAIAFTWGIGELTRNRRIPRKFLYLPALLLLTGLGIASWWQTQFWRDGVTLFTRVLDRGTPSDLIHNNLGIALSLRGQDSQALAHFQRAVELNSNYLTALKNYGDTLRTLGKFDEAITVLRNASEIEPDNELVSNSLASSLISTGQYQQAIDILQPIQVKHPDFAEALTNMGLAKLRLGKIDEAIADFRSALAMDSQQPIAYVNQGIALVHLSDFSSAIDSFRMAVKLRPDDAETLKNMAWIAASDPNASLDTTLESLAWAKRAVELTDGRNPLFLDVQAAALAANQKFEEAVSNAELALKLAAEQGKSDLVEAIRSHLNLYRERRSLR